MSRPFGDTSYAAHLNNSDGAQCSKHPNVTGSEEARERAPCTIFNELAVRQGPTQDDSGTFEVLQRAVD